MSTTTPNTEQQPKDKFTQLYQQWIQSCTPLQLYTILLVIGLIANLAMKQFTMIPLTIVIGVIMIYLLDHVCRTGYVWFAWILIFLPTIISTLYGTVQIIMNKQNNTKLPTY